jgi:hypothetical protein
MTTLPIVIFSMVLNPIKIGEERRFLDKKNPYRFFFFLNPLKNQLKKLHRCIPKVEDWL